MSLFAKLLQLHGSPRPTENFFTEIVAHLLASDEALVLDWLADLGLLPGANYDGVEVSTQVELSGKKPDMLIRLYDQAGSEDWLMVESKLGAQEGGDQLGGYARILADQAHVREKHLLYITRDYDPKEAQKVLAKTPPGSVNFQQLRWSDFYRFLQGRPQNALVREVLKYMKERRMGETNQFDSASLLTISGIPTVFGLMNATLDNEVKIKLSDVIGPVRSSNLKNLKARYVLQRGMLSKPRWYIGLGYYWSGISIGEFPELRLNLGASTDVRRKNPEVLALLQSLTEREGWYKWSNASWFAAYRMQFLQEFLAEEDHVTAVKNQFLSFIDELAEIKEAHSEVPW